MPTLELKNVSYAYEKGKAVLQNVSGSLETGKLYAILGPSGSGKTTLAYPFSVLPACGPCPAFWKGEMSLSKNQPDKVACEIELPQAIIEIFARFLVLEIRKYYDSEQGQREFAEWQDAQSKTE